MKDQRELTPNQAKDEDKVTRHKNQNDLLAFH